MTPRGLARHGEGHSLPPHKINYRANLAALQQLAQRVLALNTVGGITEHWSRVLACPDQIIDYTWGRISTICEEEGTDVVHVDFGHPYTPMRCSKILAAAKVTGVTVHDCYGATQGPRLETIAEIARMRRDGCDLVGMTGMPEAALARELGWITPAWRSSPTGLPAVAMVKRSRWLKYLPTCRSPATDFRNW